MVPDTRNRLRKAVEDLDLLLVLLHALYRQSFKHLHHHSFFFTHPSPQDDKSNTELEEYKAARDIRDCVSV